MCVEFAANRILCMKPCKGRHDTCPNTVEHNQTYCPDCLIAEVQRNKKKAREYEQDRGSSYERGYDLQWRKLRKYKLKINPLCECPNCLNGRLRVRAATVVHHIKDIETHPELRLVMDNLMSVTTKCHEKIHGRKR